MTLVITLIDRLGSCSVHRCDAQPPGFAQRGFGAANPSTTCHVGDL